MKSKNIAAAGSQREETDASLLTQSEVVLGGDTTPPPSGVEVQDTVHDQDPVQEKVTKTKTPRCVDLKLSEDKEVVVFEFVEAHLQLFDKNNPGFMKRGDWS